MFTSLEIIMRPLDFRLKEANNFQSMEKPGMKHFQNIFENSQCLFFRIFEIGKKSASAAGL